MMGEQYQGHDNYHLCYTDHLAEQTNPGGKYHGPAHLHIDHLRTRLEMRDCRPDHDSPPPADSRAGGERAQRCQTCEDGHPVSADGIHRFVIGGVEVDRRRCGKAPAPPPVETAKERCQSCGHARHFPGSCTGEPGDLAACLCRTMMPPTKPAPAPETAGDWPKEWCPAASHLVAPNGKLWDRCSHQHETVAPVRATQEALFAEVLKALIGVSFSGAMANVIQETLDRLAREKGIVL